MPRSYTAGQLVRTHRWASAHPHGRIDLGRDVCPTRHINSQDWLIWFRNCLMRKIHAHDPPIGLKGDPKYQRDLRRDADRIAQYAQHRIVDPIHCLTILKLQRRFQWHYSLKDGLSLTLHNPRTHVPRESP